MYGHFHVIIRDLICKKFGNDVWQKILVEAEENDIDHFLTFTAYDDSVTVNLFASAASVLEIPIDAVLEIYGEYFLIYCLEHGYDKMMRSLGRDFRSFIQNLDNLHSHLEITYKKQEAPSFRCDPLEADGSMNLHYYSARGALLHPLVTGMLRATGREIFGLNIRSEIIAKEEIQLHDQSIVHVTFHVTGVVPRDQLESSGAVASETNLTIPATSYISPKRFCEIFPFHVVFDSQNLIVKQCGVSIPRMAFGKSIVGENMTEIVKLHHPKMEFTPEKLLEFINLTYVLEIRLNYCVRVDRSSDVFNQLTLKGQMIHMPNKKQFLFIGSPRLSSLDEMYKSKLYMADIPLHDSTRELILLSDQRSNSIGTSESYDKARSVLKRLNQALDAEKQKGDALLYEMLPRSVADNLKNNRKQEAERFNSATVLFSSISGFEQISRRLPVEQQVELLNTIYKKLDALVSNHDIYKVETVGDVYMVVGGVPIRNEKHACFVADFALDIIDACSQVIIPVTGQPLECKVGIHTGPLCAGVIGERCPRYCLLGDTVNVASRMQSNGIPGYIHVSDTVHDHLQFYPEYKLYPRGCINVKGKGMMETHFLYGGPKKQIPFPEAIQELPSDMSTTMSKSLTHGVIVPEIYTKKSGTTVDLLADLTLPQGSSPQSPPDSLAQSAGEI